jgi:guanine deaminase
LPELSLMISPQDLMQLAIDKCRQGLARGQSPFGCAIAAGGRVIANEHNTVVLTTDITAHAEVNAIRSANREVRNILLEGAIVATTCEPCPMCMAALHWARVDTVYYGATIADAEQAGFNELQLPAAELLRLGDSSLRLVSGTLQSECKKLFDEWLGNPNRRVY